MDDCTHIEHNVRAHDKVAERYDIVHGEIFNQPEQRRLRGALQQAIAIIGGDPAVLTALDFGAGTGNLTSHLIDLGMNVVAADLSEKCLRIIDGKWGTGGRCRTLRVNGLDLSGVADASFDLAATYSVLHHVPDYLRMVGELGRVTRPGGIVYIDHEMNAAYWRKEPVYRRFRELVSGGRPTVWARCIDELRRLPLRIRRIRRPRYMPEGDIHIWPDDHIEFDRVEEALTRANCEVVVRDDYLLFRDGCTPALYEEYHNQCRDVRLLMARKR